MYTVVKYLIAIVSWTISGVLIEIIFAVYCIVINEESLLINKANAFKGK